MIYIADSAQSQVLIVGAGLAGVSAAAEIAAHAPVGTRITLVERLGVGSNHTTPMTFAEIPSRFGLEDCVIGRYTRFTFHSPLGERNTHAYQESPLVALDYARAARALLQRAQAQGDVRLLKASAAHLERKGARWLLTCAHGETLSAPLLIDASGRGLFSHRALDLPRPREFSHCYGALLSNVTVSDPGEAFFLAPFDDYGNGGGWVYPLEDGRVSLGYASLGKNPTLPAGLLMERFRRALAGFEPYAAWARQAHWERPEVGSIPIYPLRRLVWDGLLIAGDAAGQATIWSCMGSAAALEAGQLAGQAAIQALRAGDFNAKTLKSYQQAWDSRHRRTYRNNAVLSPVVWSMSSAAWNRQIPRLRTLTPHQMIERLRSNWPTPAWPVVVALRAYDLAGRALRGVATRLFPPVMQD